MDAVRMGTNHVCALGNNTIKCWGAGQSVSVHFNLVNVDSVHDGKQQVMTGVVATETRMTSEQRPAPWEVCLSSKSVTNF